MLICLIVSLSFSGLVVNAHNTSWEGVLRKSYISQYGGYYIGGDEVGWSIDEGVHTNGASLTYSFDSTDSNLTPTLKNVVRAGAGLWSGTVNIQEKTDGTGKGLITTYNEAGSGVIAKFCEFTANSSGHLTAWKIKLNRAHTQNQVVIAHEFGHAIGLNDLYEYRSRYKLMYGYDTGLANSPTATDIWGAKLITGVHSSHTWGYKYYSTNSSGNVHIKYCTQCGGLSYETGQCTYHNGVCVLCGVPSGYTPYAIGDIMK